MPDEQNLNIKIIPPKEYLPYVFVAVGAVLFVFLAALSINQFKTWKYIGQSMEYQKTVTISGTGKVFAKPDIGQIDLSVVTEANTVSTAVSDNNQKMNKIIQAIKDLGIKEDDIKTTNYSINPKYQYVSGKSSIIGYEVNQTAQVKIRDLNKTSQILEKAAGLGANQVGSLNFTIDDPEKSKDEARQKAIENAKKKAGDLTNTLGVKLGKVVGFSEYSGGEPGPISYGSTMDGRGGAGGPAPEIQTGQNEVIINVDLTYEVK